MHAADQVSGLLQNICPQSTASHVASAESEKATKRWMALKIHPFTEYGASTMH